jgi:uncharacterized protein (DUF58 family)
MWTHLQIRWQEWIERRQPPASFFILHRRNLYTFPGSAGLIYLGLTLILWLIGTNYQNNLILALAYSLMSLLVIAILHAYANLAGIEIQTQATKPVFAEQWTSLPLQLTATNRRGGENIGCQLEHQPKILIELNYQEPQQIHVPLFAPKRGWYSPGKLLLETYYPLGLIRCWTWLRLDQPILVYPKLIPGPPIFLAQTGEGELTPTAQTGNEDFAGLKTYQSGDSLKHIAWKAYAKGKDLFTKQYADDISREIWLDLNQLKEPLEMRLSIMAYWVVTLSEQHQRFGCKLGEIIIPTNQGEVHKHECLKALALFKGRV